MVQVGNEERIHVYYVHGQDNPTFARRCYWLLDKYVMVKLYVNLLSPKTGQLYLNNIEQNFFHR